jgi:dsDNA-specific endonuclease/ATPase MutS2
MICFVFEARGKHFFKKLINYKKNEKTRILRDYTNIVTKNTTFLNSNIDLLSNMILLLLILYFKRNTRPYVKPGFSMVLLVF